MKLEHTCINCLYFSSSGDYCESHQCVNYSSSGTVNAFVPDPDELHRSFPCETCAHFGSESICRSCCHCPSLEDHWQYLEGSGDAL